MSPSNIVPQLNSKLKQLTYYEKYSLDIIITFIIILVTITIVTYFSVVSNIKTLKNEWFNDKFGTNLRCTPKGIFFSEIITDNNPRWTRKKTFEWCLEQQINPLAIQNMSPFGKQFGILNSIFQYLYGIVIYIYNFFYMLYRLLVRIFEIIKQIIMSIITEIYYIIIVFQDTITKILGIGYVFNQIILKIINYINLAIVASRNIIAKCVYYPIFKLHTYISLFMSQLELIIITVTFIGVTVMVGAFLSGFGWIVIPFVLLVMIVVYIICIAVLNAIDPLQTMLKNVVGEGAKLDNFFLQFIDNLPVPNKIIPRSSYSEIQKVASTNVTTNPDLDTLTDCYTEPKPPRKKTIQEPTKWADGTLCGEGTTCRTDCAGGVSSYWWSKAFTACGKEPKKKKGDNCLAGTSCQLCPNGDYYDGWKVTNICK